METRRTEPSAPFKSFLHATKNDLSESIRFKMIELLQSSLADSVDLYQQTKQAHWTVKGPDFIALHLLFDEAAKESLEFADLVAERIEQLGGTAQGTLQAATKRTRLAAYPLDISSGHDHVDALSTAWANYGEYIRQAINEADEAEDKGTADLFTEISRTVDKRVWFIEAHLQSNR